MTNAYVTVDTLKGTGALNIAGTVYDARLRGVAEAVSREIDRYCNRVFYVYIETKTFDGDGSSELEVPDLINVGTLREDNNYDGTFDTDWAAADFLYYPANANPTSERGGPYRRLLVSFRTGATQDVFLKDVQNYQIVGTWGYRKVTKDTGLTGTLTDGTTSTLTASGTSLEIGMTLQVEAEQVYVTAVTGSAATVERAVNSTTGTAHAGASLLQMVPPEQVAEAAFIQTARLWKRKDSGFSSQVGFPETGQMVVFSGGLDSDVKELLSSFRKLVV